MAERIKNLRHPITGVINGHRVELLTVGHLARAVGRTPWTVKHWTKVGLLPPAQVIERADISNLRRYLWPAPFVAAMGAIARKDYVIRRLERKDWPKFHAEVLRAYGETIAPLLEPCVTGEMPPLSSRGE